MRTREFVYMDGVRYERSRYYVGPSGKRLHVAVWEKHNGPVPAGYVVHHVDHDPLNNELSNLQIMSRAEHQVHHIRHPDPVRLRCAVCDKEFPARRRTARHCSRLCKQTEARREGRYLVDASCVVCGGVFRTNKYLPRQCCGRSCGVALGHRSRQRRVRPGGRGGARVLRQRHPRAQLPLLGS